MDIFPLHAIETFSATEGILNNGPIPYFEVVPNRCVFTNLSDGPIDFMTHDDRIGPRSSRRLPSIHPNVRAAHSNHFDLEESFLRSDLWKRKLFQDHPSRTFKDHGL
jgi:hypothetical protein